MNYLDDIENSRVLRTTAGLASKADALENLLSWITIGKDIRMIQEDIYDARVCVLWITNRLEQIKEELKKSQGKIDALRECSDYQHGMT